MGIGVWNSLKSFIQNDRFKSKTEFNAASRATTPKRMTKYGGVKSLEEEEIKKKKTQRKISQTTQTCC